MFNVFEFIELVYYNNTPLPQFRAKCYSVEIIHNRK